MFQSSDVCGTFGCTRPQNHQGLHEVVIPTHSRWSFRHRSTGSFKPAKRSKTENTKGNLRSNADRIGSEYQADIPEFVGDTQGTESPERPDELIEHEEIGRKLEEQRAQIGKAIEASRAYSCAEGDDTIWLDRILLQQSTVSDF